MRTLQTILAALLIASAVVPSATAQTRRQYTYTQTRTKSGDAGSDTLSSTVIIRGDSVSVKNFGNGDNLATSLPKEVQDIINSTNKDSLITKIAGNWDDFASNLPQDIKDHVNQQFNGFGNNFSHSFIWKPKPADDDDALTTIMFYRDRYTGEDNNKNTALLLNLNKYLKANGKSLSPDEVSVAEGILKEMGERTTSEMQKTLLSSCFNMIGEQPDEILKERLKRYGDEAYYLYSKNLSCTNLYREIEEFLLSKVTTGVNAPTLKELGQFYRNIQYYAYQKKEKSNEEVEALKRIANLIDAVTDASTETANQAYCEQLKGIDEGIRAAQKGSYDKELEMVNELIKEESKRGMNQATLDYTRKVFGGWTETRAFFGRGGIKVAKSIEAAQKKIDKQNQKKMKMLRKKINM